MIANHPVGWTFEASTSWASWWQVGRGGSSSDSSDSGGGEVERQSGRTHGPGQMVGGLGHSLQA